MSWGRDLIEGIGAGEQLAAPISDAIMFNKNKDLQQQQITNTKDYQKGTLAAQAAALQQQGQLQGNEQAMQQAKALATTGSGAFDAGTYQQALQQQQQQIQQQLATQQAAKNVDVTHKDPSSGTTFKTTGDQALLLAKNNPQVAAMLGFNQPTTPAPAAPSTQASGSQEAPAPVSTSTNSPTTQNTIQPSPGYGAPQSQTPAIPGAPGASTVQDLSNNLQSRINQASAQRQELEKMYLNKEIDLNQYNQQLQGLDLQQKQQILDKNKMDAALLQTKSNQENLDWQGKRALEAIQLQNSGMLSTNTPSFTNDQLNKTGIIDLAKQVPESNTMPQLNKEQSDSLNFYNRLQQGVQTTDQLLSKKDANGQPAFDPTNAHFSKGLGFMEGGSLYPEWGKSDDFKQFQNAGNMIVQAIMRDDPKRDNPEAVQEFKQMYTIQPGDGPDVIAHKRELVLSEMQKMRSALPLQVQRRLGVQNQSQISGQQGQSQQPIANKPDSYLHQIGAPK